MSRRKLTPVQRKVLDLVEANSQPPQHPVRFSIFRKLERRGYIEWLRSPYGWRGVGLTAKGYAALYR